MKALSIILILCFLSIPLMAETYTTYSVGNFDYTTGSNGYSATGYSVGDYYYQSDNRGNSNTTYTVGDYTYTTGTSKDCEMNDYGDY